MYIADGDYIKDIEVNDLRNRYTLTKGSTQKMVNTLVISTDNFRLSVPKPYEYCGLTFNSVTCVGDVLGLQ